MKRIIWGGLWSVGFAAMLTGSGAGQSSASYSISDLGTLGGTASIARALNANGQVAGESFLPGNQQAHPFRYADGVLIDLNDSPY